MSKTHADIYTSNGETDFQVAVISENGEGFGSEVFLYLKLKYGLEAKSEVSSMECVNWPPDDLEKVLKSAVD